MPASPNRPQVARWQVLESWLKDDRRFTARSAASELQVSERTVRTDLDALAERGVPVAWDARRRTYALTEAYGGTFTSLVKGHELAAFLVAQHALDALGDGATADTLAHAIARLADALPDEVRVESDLFARHTRFLGDPQTASRPRWHAMLHAAIDARRIVEIRYHSASKDETTQRRVEPYALVCRQGRWYVLAYCYAADAWRDFRLDRIEALETTAAVFAGRAVDLDADLGERFGMTEDGRTHAVHIVFSAYQSRWISEETWHPTQVLTRRADGRLDLRMQVQGLADVARWVLAYGGEAEVLAPTALRRRVAHEAQRMATAYAADTPVVN